MIRTLAFVLALLVTVQSMAATAPSYSPKFGDAMAGVIQQKIVSRGFAANDPRFIATEAAIGTALTATATGLAAAAGAPLWATIAIGAVTAGAVALGISAVTQWIFNADGTATVPGTTSAPYNGQTWSDGMTATNIRLDTNGGPLFAGAVDSGLRVGGTLPFNFWWCGPHNELTCVLKPMTAAMLNGQAVAPVTASPSSLVSNVPQADMSLPASPQLLAQAVNNAWQRAAAQPGYQGMPFIASDPVTAADVSAWQSASPASYPTVGDMLSPAVNPATSAVAPLAAPGSQVQPGVNPGTSTAPSGTPQVNLGTDPVVPLPTLEATPTAQMILNPLLGLFPDLKSFVVPSHSSQCPKPSLSLFGRTMVMDGHCVLLDSVQPTLYAVMAAVWLMVAMFIILAA